LEGIENLGEESAISAQVDAQTLNLKGSDLACIYALLQR